MDGSGLTRSSNHALLRHGETFLSLALLGVLIVLIVPLPPALLDMLLATNLAISILLLLITLGVTKPLDVSVFPSLLLLLTLYRLSLNVGTTRLILLNGDAGRIVETFGGFVVGGNLVVGLVIFLILIIIQFIVITKGSSRVSEVAARFTLDAMPGKQMAIDAELSSGAIAEGEAKQRREQLTQEAEFYGAMDGAGKFVRGDAIAGLVITAINLGGGVILGLTNGLTVLDAVKRYSILTVGDGLVSQIPALIIATTAGILVTKTTSKLSLGHEIGSQVLSNHRPLFIGGSILAIVALTPGLPKIPFFAIAVMLLLVSNRLKKDAQKRVEAEQGDAPVSRPPQEDQLDQFLQTDRACIEIGVRLIPLVASKQHKGLADRVANLRTDLTRRHGIWVPRVRIRDNVQLNPETYRILVAGREVARADLRVDMLLAIDSNNARTAIEGEAAIDPAFGLPAKWISRDLKQRAELHGYTVVDASTVLITHLGEVLRRYAHELLSRQDLQSLLDKVRETAPTVVEELRPDLVRPGELHQILVLLLKERVPITNLTRILESVIQHASATKDPAELVERVRQQLARDVTDRYRGEQGRVRAIAIDPRLEVKLHESLKDKRLYLPPQELERLVSSLRGHWQKSSVEGHEVALLTDTVLRRPMRLVIERALPDLGVISFAEIPVDLDVEFIALLRVEDVFADPGTSAQGAANGDWRTPSLDTPVPTPAAA